MYRRRIPYRDPVAAPAARNHVFPSSLLLRVLAISLTVFLVTPSTGCSQLLQGLSKVAQGTQYLGTLIDVAEAGSDAYFARHPNPENEPKVGAALHKARAGQAALDALLATAEAYTQDDIQTARTQALKSYVALRDLLLELGVLGAVPPEGGAEVDTAPEPEPFDLPPPEQVEAALR